VKLRQIITCVLLAFIKLLTALSSGAEAKSSCLSVGGGAASIAADGARLAVGFPDRELVRLFAVDPARRELTVLAEVALPPQARLATASNPRFGHAVALSAETLVVSAYSERREPAQGLAEAEAGIGFYPVSGVYAFALARDGRPGPSRALAESGGGSLPSDAPRQLGTAVATDGSHALAAGADLPNGGARDGFAALFDLSSGDVRFLRPEPRPAAAFAADLSLSDGLILIGDPALGEAGGAWIGQSAEDFALAPLRLSPPGAFGGASVALAMDMAVLSAGSGLGSGGFWTIDLSRKGVAGRRVRLSEGGGSVAASGELIGLIKRRRGEGVTTATGSALRSDGASIATIEGEPGELMRVAAGRGFVAFLESTKTRGCVTVVANGGG